MKHGILKYILVVSLLMNFSLLGAAAYTHYRQSSQHPAPFVGPDSILGQAGQPRCGVNDNHLFQELSLKPEQVKMFQQKAVLFHANLNKKKQEVDRLRASLLSVMRTDSPDSKVIEETIGRINRMQEEMQKTVVSHMLEFKSMLDKDQQKKFLGMIEGAMAQRRESVCP
jgi:hypothetical protein